MDATVETTTGCTALAEQYEALIAVSQAISAHKDIHDLFQVLSTELHHVIQFDGMVVAHISDDSKLIWHIMDVQNREAKVEKRPENEVANWVIEHQEPLIIDSLAEETRFTDLAKMLLELGLQSLCMLPLTTVHRRVGTIGLASRQVSAYGPKDLKFLSLVADQTALAIDDALTSESLRATQARLKEDGERLQLLLNLTNTMVSHLDLKGLFLAMSANIRQAMNCDGIGLALPDSAGQLHKFVRDFPEDCEPVAHPIMPDEMNGAYETGVPRLFYGDDLPADSLARKKGVLAMCFYPLRSRNTPLGVLVLGRHKPQPFDERDLNLLGDIARQVSLVVENAVAYRQIAELKDRLTQQNLYLEGEIRSELNFEEIVGKSEALTRVLKQVETVGPTDSTVLIYGDTGTGKELIARAVHNLSARSKNSFVKLNCAAIPTGLLESELFGHERGAFTGAVNQRIGRFELASKGTVFLDEIGEIPLELQPKLLRVLQEREFERLGSSQTLRSEARLVAATNRDLAAMVKDQKFRADLFYRLSVFPIYVPPLRERQEDIPLLVRHFAQHFSRRMNRCVETIPSEAMEVLMRYHWPGNIRELQNLIERAVILSSGPVLKIPLQDLEVQSVANAASSGRIDTLEESERRHILQALDATDWVISGPKGAAAVLGLKRSTLQARMEKLGIRRARVAEDTRRTG